MPRSDPWRQVAALNARFRAAEAEAMLRHVLADPTQGRFALVSSFGAEAAVLLHMVAEIRRDTPVLFVDTQMLFAETLAYQRALAARLGLEDLRVIHAAPTSLRRADPDGTLHRQDPDACCALRKSAPLAAALAGFDGWITGRKRHQGGDRATLPHLEREAGTGRLKLNPLAQWSAQELRAYIDRHALPRHPLVARGYRSIGCAPCTTPTAPGEPPRAGRWRHSHKTECGIHFADGRAIREGETA